MPLESINVDLTIPLERIDVERIIPLWNDIIPSGFCPILFSKFGDIFFVDEHKRVFLLDLIEGNLENIARSISEFNNLKSIPEIRSRWFLDGFVIRCYDEKLLLRDGECYGWKIHPKIGGNFEFDNIQVFSIFVYHSLMSQLLPQWNRREEDGGISPILIDDK
jgi:hypothetical protein